MTEIFLILKHQVSVATSDKSAFCALVLWSSSLIRKKISRLMKVIRFSCVCVPI